MCIADSTSLLQKVSALLRITSLRITHTMFWHSVLGVVDGCVCTLPVRSIRISPNRLEHSINSRRSLLDKVMENFEMGSFGLKGDDGPPSLNIPSIPLKAPTAESRVSITLCSGTVCERRGLTQINRTTQAVMLQPAIDVRVAKETNYGREALPGRDAVGNNWDSASDSDSGNLKRAREQ